MTTLSLKVPKSLNARLTSVARRRGKTKSALVREALDRFLRDDGNRRKKGAISCMDLAADLCGCISGPRDLATNERYMRGFGQ